ncbi:hypothetical protein [Bradyrhizobium sp. sBnM-33]|uniref:hypothetical protein n=1 Tax=Bradyrhizobium sp. sBnM-33 TaxID=2831780 RepID=UPI001BCBEFA1|nr:hypothetical protein [Bradyrhizobium sp. sBnM-33]WOH52518.1 hypothetical protein RX328_10340 [Bradyrhizobium sp. sBnM-33]
MDIELMTSITAPPISTRMPEGFNERGCERGLHDDVVRFRLVAPTHALRGQRDRLPPLGEAQTEIGQFAVSAAPLDQFRAPR